MAMRNISRNLKSLSSLLMQSRPLAARKMLSTGEGVEIISHKVEVNGVNFHYEVAGASEHALLCLPGALGSTRSDFGPQLKGLSDKFKVVAFDPRGYGKSIPPKRDFPKDFFERDANDAAELMLKIGFNKFSVLGWSDGGITGLILAGERTELVDKLVIWGSNAFVHDEDVKCISAVRDLSKWSPKMREPLEVMYGKENLQDLWSSWMDAFFSFKENPEDGICIKSLPKIKASTLIVHGAKDPMVPGFHPEFIHKNMKDSKLHIFEEGKHNLHLRYHEEFNALVKEFLLT